MQVEQAKAVPVGRRPRPGPTWRGHCSRRRKDHQRDDTRRSSDAFRGSPGCEGNGGQRSDPPDSVYAFPKKRKEPLTDASHVRNALARFDQVEGVSDEERHQAFANIKKAGRHYGVEVTARSWRELGKPQTAGKE